MKFFLLYLWTYVTHSNLSMILVDVQCTSLLMAVLWRQILMTPAARNQCATQSWWNPRLWLPPPHPNPARSHPPLLHLLLTSCPCPRLLTMDPDLMEEVRGIVNCFSLLIYIMSPITLWEWYVRKFLQWTLIMSWFYVIPIQKAIKWTFLVQWKCFNDSYFDSDGCLYKGVSYNAGQTWKDGCFYTCECLDMQTGRYRCKDRYII